MMMMSTTIVRRRLVRKINMVYTLNNPNQLVYLTQSYANPVDLINLCNSALGNQFQTQNARTTVQKQFSDAWQSVPSLNVRFPPGVFYVFRYNMVIEPLVTALLNSFDTRNRIIEVEDQQSPTTTETINATRRVDDATVNIRSCISNLMNELSKGTGTVDQVSFETMSNLTWATASK
nr:MAG: coat protein [Piper chlorosis virus]